MRFFDVVEGDGLTQLSAFNILQQIAVFILQNKKIRVYFIESNSFKK